MSPEASLQAIDASVSRETLSSLETFVTAVIDENSRQNLISKATVSEVWWRHVADSAQLLPFAPENGVWLDLGTGAGFPGMVAAIILRTPTVLVEARSKRAAFLRSVCKELALAHVEVVEERLERVRTRTAATISARAFAPLVRLLPLAHRFSTPETVWLLPKGRSAVQELETVRATWHGDFRIQPSKTDPSCGIIVATNVRPKGKSR